MIPLTALCRASASSSVDVWLGTERVAIEALEIELLISALWNWQRYVELLLCVML